MREELIAFVTAWIDVPPREGRPNPAIRIHGTDNREPGNPKIPELRFGGGYVNSDHVLFNPDSQTVASVLPTVESLPVAEAVDRFLAAIGAG